MKYPKTLTPEQYDLLEEAGISYASLASTLNCAWTEGIRFDDARQFHKYCYYHYVGSEDYVRQQPFREITEKVYNIMLRNRPEYHGPFQMYEMQNISTSPVIDVGKVKVHNTTFDSWGNRLRHIKDFPDLKLIISTYSLNNINYISAILGNRRYGKNIHLICHERFADGAVELKKALPLMCIYLRPDIHTKIVLLEPNIVFHGSDNFGKGGYFNEALEFRSKEFFDYEYNMLLHYLRIDDFKAGGGDL